MTTDTDPTVRAELLHGLTWQGRNRQRRPEPAEAAADEVARYARSCTPPGLKALATLRRLTFDDLLPELASHDLERRRTAAHLLARNSSGIRKEEVPQDVLDGVVGRLLRDPDPLLRSHGVAVVHWFNLVHLHPVLRKLQERETDPWVLDNLRWCLAKQPRPAEECSDPWAPAPPF